MDSINMHLLQYNANLTDSDQTNILNLSKNINNLIGDLSDWNVFLKNLLITSLDLPICNLYKYITDYNTGKTLFSITLYDETGYNFFVAPDTLYFGIDEDGNTSNYKGICVYLQFNNSEFPTFDKYANTKYYNLHYIQNFLNMINNALKIALNAYSNVSLHNTLAQFVYTAGQPYSLYISDAFVSSTINLYFNNNLKNILDGFNVQFISPSIMTSPNYNGMNYLFVKTNTFNNYFTTAPAYWIYYAEYQTVNTLSSYIGLGIECSGSLSCVRDSVYSYFDNSNASINVQMKKILKILDFDYNGYNSVSGNNFLQYESLILDLPVNCLSTQGLLNLQLNFYLINIDGSFQQIQLPSNGCVKCNIVFKRK